MSFDSIISSASHHLNPVDFLEGLYDGAIGQPLNAIRQLAGAHVEPNDRSHDSMAQTAGSLVGSVVDFALLSRLAGSLLSPVLGTAANSVLGSALNMGLTGAIYGGLLTPSSNDRGLLQGRLENSLVDATSFAAMGGVSSAPMVAGGRSQLRSTGCSLPGFPCASRDRATGFHRRLRPWPSA